MSPPAVDGAKLPLATSLRGEFTVLRIDFPAGAQSIQPGEFSRDEVCYLKLADIGRIDCFTDGSTLTFGRNAGPADSVDLLTDNPSWNLAPADSNDEQGNRNMKNYAIVSLVAGSVDRLPRALSDYFQNPGQRLDKAIDFSQHLLNDKRVQLHGFARGGNFTITVQLNDDGRQKLLEGLDELSEPASQGDVQFVHHSSCRH